MIIRAGIITFLNSKLAVRVEHGTFFIKDIKNYSWLAEGEAIIVRYDPQDQFASFVDPEKLEVK